MLSDVAGMDAKNIIYILSAFLIVYIHQLQAQDFDCDPCIKRSEYRIKAIVHGTTDDLFWRQAKAAAEQTGKDMGVEFEMNLYESFEILDMVSDIESVAWEREPPDALIVTLPHDAVKDAIKMVVNEGIPVFAFNSGYETGPVAGVLGFVGQDEHLAGVEAANQFLQQKQIKKALFVNHAKGVACLEMRLNGFNHTMLQNTSIPVDELVVDTLDAYSTVTDLNKAFMGCPYDAVLLGGDAVADVALSAFDTNKCFGRTLVGTFDESSFIYTSIVQNKLLFTISQQQYLQTVLPVVMASVYATTGRVIVQPTGQEIIMTGPNVITSNNIPTDRQQTCASDSFPTCPNELGPDGKESDCGCFDRRNIRIAGVVHGGIDNPFFSRTLSASQQAAIDMGIELDFNLLDEEENDILLYQKMSARIKALCESSIDGIFVSIPDDIVVEGIQTCLNLGVPIMSINSGAVKSEELGLWLHIGQLEHTAGYGAAERLVAAGMKSGYCILHDRTNLALIERCEGFEAGIEAHPGVKFGGTIDVPGDDTEQYRAAIDDFVDLEGEWEGIGIISLAAQHINRALAVKDTHNKLLLGSFDISDDVIRGIREGRIQFGIDQQPTMQGMMPIYLLTWAAYSKQNLISNHNFQTGPKFIVSAPSAAEVICENNNYAVCAFHPDEDMHLISSHLIYIGYMMASLTCLVALVCLAWIYYFRKSSAVTTSQPRFLILLIFGAIISSLSIFTMGFQTEYRVIQFEISSGEVSFVDNPLVRGVDAACMATHWLYGIGFAITFSALFAKIRRVKKIHHASSRFIRRSVAYKEVLNILFVMIFIETVLLLSWQLVSPDKWDRKVTLESDDGFVLESVGGCTSESGWIFLVCIVVFHVICLLYALILCYQTKDILAESSWVSLPVMCLFQVLIIAIPIYIMVEDNKNLFYFVRAFVVFLQSFTVLCLIFFPKMFGRGEKGNSIRRKLNVQPYQEFAVHCMHCEKVTFVDPNDPEDLQSMSFLPPSQQIYISERQRESFRAPKS